MNFKVGISETASTDMSNMVDVQAIVTAIADMEAQMKEQEQQFAVQMQDLLEKTTEILLQNPFFQSRCIGRIIIS
jgi:hypothetical protein